jgi:hypothetical protein
MSQNGVMSLLLWTRSVKVMIDQYRQFALCFRAPLGVSQGWGGDTEPSTRRKKHPREQGKNCKHPLMYGLLM